MNKQALIDEIGKTKHSPVGEWAQGVDHERTRVLELINKHLPDNEVSVPVEPTEAMIEDGASTSISLDSFGVSARSRVRSVYKAMLQAHKSEEV